MSSTLRAKLSRIHAALVLSLFLAVVLAVAPARAADEEEAGFRCGTPEADPGLAAFLPPGDCAYFSTTPSPVYNPGVTYVIPVVVHIIQSTAGEGSAVTDARVQSQIDVLNEDYQAIAGTPGAPGTNVAIQFQLATVDTNGNPTTGITRSTNDLWYNDGGSYWNVLAWNPYRYLNIYVNSAGGGGTLGYVPQLPQGGIVGSRSDRVVIYWRGFGRPSELFAYSMGRTTTHEVGHYLGLWHTFQGACASAAPPGCYTSGDVICDTNPEASYTAGCPPSRTTCSLPAPYHNYLDYSNDNCMNNFTVEQMRRMRCTLINYRPLLYTILATSVDGTPAGLPRVPGLELGAASPNPFGLDTSLRFMLPGAGPTSVSIYDERGRLVRTLVNASLTSGEHVAAWDGADAGGHRSAPGIYFARLSFAGDSRTTKIVLDR